MKAAIKNDDDLLASAKEITSVSKYLEVLSYLKKYKGKEKTLFFRGNANSGWFDIPSVYRNSNYIKNESLMYHEIISRCPDDFDHCKTTLDHLVMMQHYQLPTRLLDITENPLIALYFACLPDIETSYDNEVKTEKEMLCDGKINIYQISSIEIKNYDSDTASMVANLAKIQNNFDISIQKMNITMDILEDTKNYPIEELAENTFMRNPMGRYTFFEKGIELLEKEIRTGVCRNNELFKSLIEKLNSVTAKSKEGMFIDFQYLTDITIDLINAIKYKTDFFRSFRELQKEALVRLTHFIKDEKPYFDPDRMIIRDLESVVCVKTKQNNPHIIKQTGSFFLFGVKQDSTNKNECASISADKYFTVDEKKVECIIPNGSKKDILEELKSLSISESYLFPEIEYVAKSLKEKYGN